MEHAIRFGKELAERRQTWTCHWYDPRRACAKTESRAVISKQQSPLQAAYEFVFRRYYDTDNSCNPDGQGHGIVHVQGYHGTPFLVEAKWWLGEGLEGVCRLLGEQGKPIRSKKGQLAFWGCADEWTFPEFRWGAGGYSGTK